MLVPLLAQEASLLLNPASSLSSTPQCDCHPLSPTVGLPSTKKSISRVSVITSTHLSLPLAKDLLKTGSTMAEWSLNAC